MPPVRARFYHRLTISLNRDKLKKVSDVMTRDVRSCSCHDTIAEVMTVMTQERSRHLPVINDGKVVGMISIGDVVKQRLDDAELEVESLRGYVTM